MYLNTEPFRLPGSCAGPALLMGRQYQMVILQDGKLHQEQKLPVIPIERQKAMPKSGFRMKVQPVTDEAWRQKFRRQANEKVAAVMEHAKTFFKHATLVTKYELDVLPVQSYRGTLSATGPNLK